MIYWTALVMGLAGSLHCVGMCSPLAIAVTSQRPFISNKILYNLGRIFTYGLLGAVAATFGSVISLGPFRDIISFAVGGFFLLMGLGGISGVKIPLITSLINRMTAWLKGNFSFWLKKKNRSAIVLLGVLNGLLPCGLTYIAMTYCFILPGIQEGFLFMVAFGFGTWPVMFGLPWIVSQTTHRVLFNFNKARAFAFVLVGVLLIARIWWHKPHEQDQMINGSMPKQTLLCE
jgi:uncharacterized protein